jgi:hypothetical protein
VNNSAEALKISSNIESKINILFTQFGYAGWVGNESDTEYRFKTAQEKFERIKIQADGLKPNIIIPFASFVYFSHSDNFYLNDLQNTPEKLRAAKDLSSLQDNIFFMKPFDEIILKDECRIRNKLHGLTAVAEHHWNSLMKNIKPNINKHKPVSLDPLRQKFKKYLAKIYLNFLISSQILELVGFIKPLKIQISDLLITVRISYIKGIKVLDNKDDFDISMKSDVLDFILSNDYGYNSTSVNGRYRTKDMEANIKFGRFFSPQEYIKNGYGLMSPINSIAMVWKRFVH